MVWEGLRQAVNNAPAGGTVAVSARLLGADERWSAYGDRPVSAASTIKVAILIAVAEAFDHGRLDDEQRASVSPADKVAGSGVLNWLHDGLTLTVADLAWLMIAISDNTASNMLIDRVGIDAIHAICARLGATGTRLNRHFMRPRGPDDHNIVTADDLATLLTAIAEDRAASPDRCAWMRRLLADQQDRDRLARLLPEGVAFAGKSGWQTGISHDCALLTGQGGTIAIAALTEGYADHHQANDLLGRIGQAAGAVVAGASDA
ncbi:MAG: class A beta-lactamase-related serine hydrolase [Chloroflexota bacterium]|nr:class A beta-lactamase-related serine hydrolase [Chloroflexota bacterium]